MDQQAAGLATAAKAAGTGKAQHFITGVLASYSAAADIGLLEIKDGTTVIARLRVHESASVQFATPLAGSPAAAVSAELAAAVGTGDVTLIGYTVGA